MTSQSFADRSGEPSVDLYDSLSEDECNQIKLDNDAHIKQGFGIANANVGAIRSATKSSDGDVELDPLADNQRHAVISGTLTPKKRKLLRDLFNVCVEPDPVRYFEVQSQAKKNEQQN